MPNIRRLAYRDAFVWSLVQTMTGGSSTLPPIYFTEGVPTTFQLSFTLEEWTKILSALYTGADLSYPDESHEVIWSLLRQLEYPPMPNAFAGSRDIFPYEMFATSGGVYATQLDSLQWHGMYGAQATPAINNAIELSTPVFLEVGDYAVVYVYQKNNNSGIATLDLVDGSGNVALIGTVDQYNASLQRNQIEANAFQITVRGNYRFRKRILSKNASSAGYDSRWTRLSLWGWD